jgi:hypothetical protein
MKRLPHRFGGKIMTHRNLRLFALAIGVAAIVFAIPLQSQGQCTGCTYGSVPYAQTTYAPVYTPTYYSAYTPYASSCQSCSYAAYYPSYAYAPAAVTAYQPVVAAYPLTTYRPFLGTYQTRLVPYTTYRSYYTPAVSCSVGYYGYTTAYSAAPSCSSCGGCTSYSPCTSCGYGAVTYYDGPAVVSYAAPSCGCASPAVVAETPVAGPPAAAQPTYKTKKPETPEPETPKGDIKPIPATGATKSSTTPTIPDPNDRSASRTTTSSARVQFTGRTIQTPPVAIDSGWQPAKD